MAHKRSRFGTIDERKDRRGYYVRFWWRGRRYRRAAGPTKRIAVQKLANTFALLERGWSIEETLSEVYGDVFGPRLTFQEAVPEYLQFAETRKKPSTLERDRLRLRKTCESSWTKQRLVDIQARDIQRWITELQGIGLSVATLNRYRAIVSAVFKWCFQMGYVSENPVKRVAGFCESDRARDTYLTRTEARALIECAEPLFRPMVLTAIYTGVRRSELLSLRWRDVDFARRELAVLGAYSKTKKKRFIPLAEELESGLKALREERKTVRVDGSDRVFLAPDGSPTTISRVRGMMDRAVASCEAIADEKKPEVTLHVLRHTFASLAAQSGVTFFELGKLLGHSTPAMTARYSHFFAEGARAAIDRLGGVLKPGAGEEVREKVVAGWSLGRQMGPHLGPRRRSQP